MFSTRLRKASFNGVSFEVVSSEFNFGRRNITHEYPQRDIPYTEDLGRLKRQFTVTGFIIGTDYIQRTKRLINAIEEPKKDSNGIVSACKLIHPWLGTLNVYPIDTPRITWDAEKRISNFTLTFIEAGESKYPHSAGFDFGSKLRTWADNFAENVLDTFNLSVEDLDQYTTIATDIANGTYFNILGCLSDSTFSKIFDLSDSISNLITTAASDLSHSSSFVSSLFDSLGVGNYSNVIQNWRNAGHAVLNLIHSDELSTTSSVTSTALGTSQGTAQGTVQGTAVDFRQTDINTQKSELAEAVKTSVRLTLLAQLAGIVSLVGTNLDGESDGDIDTAGNTKSEDEILALRNEVLSVIEAEMIYQGTDDSNLYESLEELYSNVYHYFTNEVLADGKTITVTPKEPQPTLVLAYEQYGDTSRVDEIIRRNNIHFPLFMQKVPIRITKSVS